jgi:hypothetical protein
LSFEMRLAGGPQDGQIYQEDDFRGRILATQRMGHTDPLTPQGWALGYRPPISGHLWTWADGANCHPLEDVDPQLLLPYGAHLRADQEPVNQVG